MLWGWLVGWAAASLCVIGWFAGCWLLGHLGLLVSRELWGVSGGRGANGGGRGWLVV